MDKRGAIAFASQSRKSRYFGTASFAAALVLAQFASVSAARAQDADLEEVVVTASRVDRAGFEAPTPTTTVGLAELQKTGTTNVADYLTTVPAFGAAWTPASSAHNSVGNAANLVNLRSLGQNRTLVLVDRKRFTPSPPTGGSTSMSSRPCSSNGSKWSPAARRRHGARTPWPAS
jgi:iron complex outermembrane receptor protein